MKRRLFFCWAGIVAACGAWLAVANLWAQVPPNDTVAAQGEALPGSSAPSAAAGAAAGSLFYDLYVGLRSLWLENTLTAWSLLLAAIFSGFLAGRICGAVLARAAQGLQARRRTAQAQIFSDLVGPANLAIFTLGLTFGLGCLSKTEEHHVFWAFCTKTLLLLYALAIFWYAYNLIGIIDVLLRRLTRRPETALDQQVAPLVRKTLRTFLVVLGLMFVFDKVFGQDIGAWLAGLGIAGLAVSLAAQDSLKNLFGSITILLDRPFKIGERIIVSGFDGTVEEIGFRSTKLRTLTGNLVNIPNANIVNSPVENVGRRPSIQRVMNLAVTYDTPLEKVRQAVEIVRDLLEEEGIREPIHATINGTEFPPRVYFNDYKADSLNMLVIYWFAPPSWWDYMDHAQRLNLRIFEEFEKAGIEFAFPTQTLHLAGDAKRELVVRTLGKDV